MNQNFIHLINQLTQSDVKKSRSNTFKKTLTLREQRKIFSLLAQKIFYAQGKHPRYKQQLDDLSLKLLELSQQTTCTSEQLSELIEKYQELIRLILMGFAGGSSDGAGAKLQMQPNKKISRPKLIEVAKKTNVLFEENTRAQQNPYQSIGELVVNIIIGIFSFFISDLEELDEETKKELNQALTNYKQEQKANAILQQINLLLKQIHAAPTTSKKTIKNISFPSPLKLRPTPGGGSSSKKDNE